MTEKGLHLEQWELVAWFVSPQWVRKRSRLRLNPGPEPSSPLLTAGLHSLNVP